MKKLATLLLCFLLLPSAALAKGPDPIAIYVNGRELFTEEAAPTIRHNRTFLPLRAVTEELGYTVAWNGDKGEVTLTKGDSSVIMTIGEKAYRLGGKELVMDVAPYLEKNRTFIPARYLGEATGLPVKWMPKVRVVTVGSYPQKDAPAGERIYVKDVNMSFVLPKDVEITYKLEGKSLCFYEKSNEEKGGDGFLFDLSKVNNPKAEWYNWPVILAYKDGVYYGADFRGEPAMIQDKDLKEKFEKAHDRIDDILMTVRVGK
ncbi:copper amine oxidase N-terminal domain-containing protein [Aedoeadaptatus acetigenes]|uniref:copper amine oxidase N-terminal domain-containing protein n=1 Tax=Aedoeadaptatus acetigenes TaxID=2981723 RepID=UPI0011DD197E|nr:copper amine oxidase N-terminal domain-containing protein [Aedoeadaptatus acetigenes]MCU6786106.1 copper amine oxidase N-terminal domain-containing protein [Aedoeadaptatus acetigenes]